MMNRVPTILVIEDEPEIARLIGSILESDGMHVISTDQSEPALAAARATACHAIILDLVLPGRSGLGILAELKAHPTLRRVPVIVVSALAASFPPTWRGDVVEVIAKPFDADHLIAVVRRAVESSLPPDPHPATQP